MSGTIWGGGGSSKETKTQEKEGGEDQEMQCVKWERRLKGKPRRKIDQAGSQYAW